MQPSSIPKSITIAIRDAMLNRQPWFRNLYQHGRALLLRLHYLVSLRFSPAMTTWGMKMQPTCRSKKKDVEPKLALLVSRHRKINWWLADLQFLWFAVSSLYQIRRRKPGPPSVLWTSCCCWASWQRCHNLATRGVLRSYLRPKRL